MPYLKVVDLENKLDSVATSSSGYCRKDSCPEQTVPGGRKVFFVNISAPSTPDTPRTPVLISGGVHAREWAPPDALVSFIAKLIDAGVGNKPAKYGPFAQSSWAGKPLPAPRATPVRYPEFTVPADAVQSVLDEIDLYIVPLVNPDGRAFSRHPDWNRWWWRKNRASQGSVGTCLDTHGLDQNVGVDLNRNFDICWKGENFYDPTYFASTVKVHTATATCVGSTPLSHEFGQTFRGANEFSEVEARNLQWLQEHHDIQFFVDVHSHGPTILFPWGIAEKNTTDDSLSFLNSGLGATRDATTGEFIPATLEARLTLIGGRMHDGILKTATADARASSSKRFSCDYQVKQSASGLYPTTGACDDYFFSRQFAGAPVSPFHASVNPPERFAFTIECGSDAEGLFWPQYDHEFPKIEREVHAALWSLLTHIASPLRAASSSWPILQTP